MRLLLRAALVALATWGLGWWAVPVVAALLALLSAWRAGGSAPAAAARASVALEIACAAALGWAALLALDAAGAQFGAVGGILGRLMPVPWPAVAALTLLLPACLAWCAAAVAEGGLALVRMAPERRRSVGPGG